MLGSKRFFDPIPRNIKKSVLVKKKLVAKINIPTTAEVNRDVLGKLLRLTMKSGQIIDFEEALKYPLSPIPPSLSYPDATKRITAKTSLMKVIDYTQLPTCGR